MATAPVPQESILEISSPYGPFLASDWKTPSAMVDLQMLPRQTKRTEIGGDIGTSERDWKKGHQLGTRGSVGGCCWFPLRWMPGDLRSCGVPEGACTIKPDKVSRVRVRSRRSTHRSHPLGQQRREVGRTDSKFAGPIIAMRGESMLGTFFISRPAVCRCSSLRTGSCQAAAETGRWGSQKFPFVHGPDSPVYMEALPP